MPAVLTRPSPSLAPPLGASVRWSHPLAHGLKGLWLFNEGAGNQLQNLALQGQPPAVLTGGPTWRANLPGYGVKFDGVDDYAVEPYDSNLNCTAGLTIEALVFMGTAGNVWWVLKPFAVTHSNPFADYGIYHDAGVNFRIGGNVQSNVTINNSTLYHIVVTADGTTKYWYTNGIQRASAAAAVLPTNTNSQGIRFGANAAAGEPYDGQMFKVAIYNRALLPCEVMELYLNPYAMVQQGGFGLRTMLQGSGSPPAGITFIMNAGLQRRAYQLSSAQGGDAFQRAQG